MRVRVNVRPPGFSITAVGLISIHLVTLPLGGPGSEPYQQTDHQADQAYPQDDECCLVHVMTYPSDQARNGSPASGRVFAQSRLVSQANQANATVRVRGTRFLESHSAGLNDRDRSSKGP